MADNETGSKERTRAIVTVSMQLEVKQAIDQAAREQGVKVATYIREAAHQRATGALVAREGDPQPVAGAA